MKPVALALTFAIVWPALPARAAPPGASEASRRELEDASGLELSHAWSSYRRDRPSSSFARYVDRRFRTRRNVGLGLAVAGGAVVFTSIFFLCFGITGGELARVNTGLAAGGFAVGGGLLVSGAVLSGVYTRRLERIEDAAADLGRPNELARRTTPGGFGLRFAF